MGSIACPSMSLLHPYSGLPKPRASTRLLPLCCPPIATMPSYCPPPHTQPPCKHCGISRYSPASSLLPQEMLFPKPMRRSPGGERSEREEENKPRPSSGYNSTLFFLRGIVLVAKRSCTERYHIFCHVDCLNLQLRCISSSCSTSEYLFHISSRELLIHA